MPVRQNERSEQGNAKNDDRGDHYGLPRHVSPKSRLGPAGHSREWQYRGSSAPAAAPGKHTLIPATGVTWGPVPPGFPPGAKMAVVSGDPASSGPFVIRAQLPAGYTVAPHWHPTDENVTVLKGTFLFGMGDTFDPEAMNAFPAGSFAFLDPNMHHFAMAQGETVVQVHGQSPLQFNYVNPGDDPSKSK